MAKPKAKTLQQRFGFMDDDLKKPKHDEMMIWLDANIEKFLLYHFPDTYKPEWDKDEVAKLTAQARAYVTESLDEFRAALEKEQARLNEFLASDDFSHWQLSRIEELNKRIPIMEAWLEWLEPGCDTFDIGEPPIKPTLRKCLKVTWEAPVTSGKGFIIGFIDMVIHTHKPTLGITRLEKYGEVYPLFGDLCRDSPPLVGEWEPKYPTWVLEMPWKGRINIEVKTEIKSLGELLRQIRMYQEYKQGLYAVVCPDDTYAPQIESQGIKLLKYDPVAIEQASAQGEQ